MLLPMRRGRIVALSLLVAATVFTSGCWLFDFDREREVDEGTVVASEKARDRSPDVPVGDLAALAAGNRAFAFDLYDALRGRDGNLFYSPYSISIALAMTYAGARGETEQQMARTLHFTLGQDGLHPAFNDLDLKLTSRGEGAEGQDGKPFRLKIANSIWGQIEYTFLPEFLDVLAENYGAALRLLDFVGEPEQSRVIINEWVSAKTEDKIKDLLPAGSITPLTRLVLTNAIYFNAAWKYKFEKDCTRDEPFYLLDGGQVAVPMMSQTETFGYAEGDGYQAVELLYDGEELSMVILLPDSGRFAEFESSLDADLVASIVDSIGFVEVDLTMPRFTYESGFSLAETLAAMGMPDAFSMNADFSGMDGRRQLFISDVFHKAFVLVNESGTEAAAATGVVVGLTSVGPEPVVVRIERPFIFMIRDRGTDTILFVGRVLNPK